jgi:signal transduction histidine kinase
VHASPSEAIHDHPGSESGARPVVPDAPHRVHHIVKLGFIVRVSMYPVFLAVYGVHLYSRPAISPWILLFIVLHPFIWPHVARAVAIRSADSRRAELRNLLIDAFIIGCYVPLTGYSIWPNAAGLLSITVGNGSVGGGKFALRAMAVTIFGAVITGLIAPQAVELRGATLLTECLSVGTLLIYVFVIGLNSFDQSRKFVQANRQVSVQNVLFEKHGVILEERTQALEVALRSAEAANAAKGHFLANMSHELRTPLNAIIGFANILQRNRDGRLRPDEVTYLARIGANGSHLLTLINGILDLSKIDAGEMPLEIVSVDVSALIRDTLSELEPVASVRRVRLVAHVPPVAILDADRGRLKQVLFNLVGNAIKFTFDGSVTISIAVDPVTRAITRIDVTDTGVGISPERLDAVFEAFQQEDTTTARKYGGTGLGLTITRSLVELMGWHIRAASVVGKGSTFSVIVRPNANEVRVPSIASPALRTHAAA